MKGHLDIKKLEGYKKADLQNLAKELGVSDAGTVKEIAARCAAVEVELPEEEEHTETGQGTEGAAGEPGADQETPEETLVKEVQKEQEKKEQAAGMVKVEVTEKYLDKQFNQVKEIGEVFSVSKERAAVLIGKKVVKIKE